MKTTSNYRTLKCAVFNSDIKDIDKQEYEWREKVREYANIEPYVDELASELFEPNETE